MMDPTVALADVRQQLELAERAESLAQANVHRENALAAFRRLDEWLSSGGFPPAQWGNLTTRDVVGDIQRELEPNPWRGPRWAGSLTAAEVLGTKLRGDA